MGKVVWVKAPDIKSMIRKIVVRANLDWIKTSHIYCLRSENSSTKATARIWSLPSPWQISLNIKPKYIIEVISERFDKLSISKKEEVLMHELAHIPKNFTGSLLPHVKKRGKRNFDDRVKKIVNTYRKS